MSEVAHPLQLTLESCLPRPAPVLLLTLWGHAHPLINTTPQAFLGAVILLPPHRRQ